MEPSGLAHKSTILVVDDTPDNLNLMSALLKDHYKVKVANSGEKALRIAQSDSPPDLILLDIMMPIMDGYEVISRLKRAPETSDIPVIFLTGKSTVEDERKGLELGAVDYITKPISPPVVIARVKTHLLLKESTDFLRNKADFLEQEVAKRTREVNAIQDVTILVMASLAETRDPETGNHIRRTQHYVKVLALKLRSTPSHAYLFDDTYISLLFKSAPLHDIGKVGIPDKILLKPRHYEAHEFEIMKTHTTLGWQAIDHAEKSLGVEVKFLKLAKEIALSHHENFDGTGYPQGLVGKAIPTSARLMAVADVYDALVNERVYKDAKPHEYAVRFINESKGSRFDPDIVDAFMELQDEFRRIAKQFAEAAMIKKK